MQILIVEDNDMNRDMLSRRLTRRGYTVLGAADGMEGIMVAREQQPALILLDLNLPLLDGWEVAQQLKTEPLTADIPIIALTAHAMQGDEGKALQAGCDDYESKPIDFPRLLTKIVRLLGAEPAS